MSMPTAAPTSHRRPLTIHTLAIVAGSAAAVAAPSIAQSITPLGVQPGDTRSRAMAVSANGSFVVGSSEGPVTSTALLWTRGVGVKNLGTLPGDDNAIALAVSADGNVVVGYSRKDGINRDRAFRWTPAGGMQDLGKLGSLDIFTYAFGMSSLGEVIVGGSAAEFAPIHAYTWTAAAGMRTIPGLPLTTLSIARDANFDASVIVGNAYSSADGTNRAFRWTAAGVQYLGALGTGLSTSTANAVSVDGLVVVGYSDIPSGARAFRWTGGSGMVNLGALPGHTDSYAYDTSAEGTHVVGQSGISPASRAFLWTQPLGLVDLNAYLPTLGIGLAGWTLESAAGVSANTLNIVGSGLYNGRTEGWIVELAPPPPPPPPPPPCRANCNGDTNPLTGKPRLDVQDFACYQNAFALGDLAKADTAGPAACAPDGQLTIQDFVCFQNLFAQGCP